MSYLEEAKKNAKKMPKAVYVAAIVLPFGLMSIMAYLAVKSYFDNRKKNDRS